MQVRTQVRDAMTKPVLVIGPDHTLRQAAQLMAARRVGSAIVIDPDSSGVGIMTERDVLNAVGAGLDPDTERTASHITWDVVYAGPSWTLEEAAVAMARGGFRHLVVLEGDEVLGVISVRDIMRVWAQLRTEATAATPV
jgi:signal-transduction protein with cAMP-binding, CBS, and nucleotidyltransferase domain